MTTSRNWDFYVKHSSIDDTHFRKFQNTALGNVIYEWFEKIDKILMHPALQATEHDSCREEFAIFKG